MPVPAPGRSTRIRKQKRRSTPLLPGKKHPPVTGKEGSGLWQGMVDFSPVALVISSYAIIFGALAVSSGLSVAESCLMSLTVFAGASQFIALPMIRDGSAPLTLILMALVVNMRHLLYGLNIGRLFRNESKGTLMGLSFGIVDETYAFITVGPGRKRASVSYFMGTALCAYLTWNLGTLAGAAIFGWLNTGQIKGMDFAMLAVFTAMVGSSIKGKDDWLVLICAGTLSMIVYSTVGGYWHLIVTGIAVPVALSIVWQARRKTVPQ